jgi:carbon starvation protein CstA
MNIIIVALAVFVIAYAVYGIITKIIEIKNRST